MLREGPDLHTVGPDQQSVLFVQFRGHGHHQLGAARPQGRHGHVHRLPSQRSGIFSINMATCAAMAAAPAGQPLTDFDNQDAAVEAKA